MSSTSTVPPSRPLGVTATKRLVKSAVRTWSALTLLDKGFERSTESVCLTTSLEIIKAARSFIESYSKLIAVFGDSVQLSTEDLNRIKFVHRKPRQRNFVESCLLTLLSFYSKCNGLASLMFPLATKLKKSNIKSSTKTPVKLPSINKVKKQQRKKSGLRVVNRTQDLKHKVWLH